MGEKNGESGQKPGVPQTSDRDSTLRIQRPMHPQKHWEGSYLPDASDFAPSPVRRLSHLRRIPRLSTATPAILFFALAVLLTSLYWYGPFKDMLWVSRRSIFDHGEYHRLFTALFVHADLGHLLSNAPMFLIFGWWLTAFFGYRAFPLASLFLGALANLATVYFYNNDTHLIGASGMVYAMVANWLILFIRYEIDLPLSARVVRALGFALVVMFPTTFKPTTSYLAHGIGFALGLISGMLISLPEEQQSTGVL
jgi:rhomboid protease GluP